MKAAHASQAESGNVQSRGPPTGGRWALEPGMLVHILDAAGGHLGEGGQPLEGTLSSFSSSSGCWEVLLCDGSRRQARPEELKPLLDCLPASSGRRAAAPAGAPSSRDAERPELQSGRRARLIGLKTRADLNGQEGTLVEYAAAESRWRVRMDDGTGKAMKPEHLQLCEELLPGGSGGATAAAAHFEEACCTDPSLAARFADSRSVEALLTVCEASGMAQLTPALVNLALRRVAQSDDRGVMFADPRFSQFLSRMREAFDSSGSPQEVVEAAAALVELDLQSMPCLEALARCVTRQAGSFSAAELVKLMSSFSRLGHADLAAFDAMASALHGKVPELQTAEALQAVVALARVRLQQFDLLDQLALHVSSQLATVGDEELAEGAWAFAYLEVPDVHFRLALISEVQRRCARTVACLKFAQAAQLARALAPQFCSGAELAREALARCIGPLVGEGGVEDLAVFADALPGLEPSVEGRMLAVARQAAALLKGLGSASASAVAADGAVLWSAAALAAAWQLRQLCATGLGARGTRCAVAALGVRRCQDGFAGRGIDHISWAQSNVEELSIRTRQKKSYAFAEYCIPGPAGPGGASCQGDFVCHDRQRPTETELGRGPLKSLLAEGILSAAELDAACIALTQLHGRLLTADGAGYRRDVRGTAQLYLMDPPSMVALLAFACFRSVLPGVVLSLAIGTEVAADGAPLPDLDEVLDVEFDAKERMEPVD